MPTLIELAGFPLPPADTDPSHPLGGLGGISLVPVLTDPQQAEAEAEADADADADGVGVGVDGRVALTQYPRCGCTYNTDAYNRTNGTCALVYHHVGGVDTGPVSGASNHHACLVSG